MALSDRDTFEHGGYTFQVRIEADCDAGTPWERNDGHGPVSEWTRRPKRPGERVLATDHNNYRYYDFEAAVKIAKRDGWDAPPYNTGTAGERAVRAANADFENLQRWCNDSWSYVGVVVTRLDDTACPTSDSASLWGVESDSYDYLDEVARELADQVLHDCFAMG